AHLYPPARMSRFAEIAVPVAVYATYTYEIPADLEEDVRLGSRVEVQIGAKATTGFVVGFPEQAPPDAARMKSIRRVLDEDETPLIPDVIALCRWAAEYYIAPPGEML